MRKVLRHSIIFLIVIFISGSVFSQTSNGKKKMFKSFYNLDNVYKAEMTLFKENNYVLVDYIELLKIIDCSRIVISKFIPYKEVTLYKQDSSTSTIYFSKGYQRLKLEGKTFALTKKQSKKIAEILNY
jgi:hypothetical protein